jgi:hypothetical protein
MKPSFLVTENLHNTLIEHRVSHFHEPSDVRANYEVARVPVFGRGLPRVFVNRGHDVTQP